MKLEGKTAIVTGSRRGIGFGIAKAMAHAGAEVVISDIDLKDCELAVQEIESAGGRGLAVECDVSSREQVENLVKETINAYGKVDILVNNAGIARFKPFLEMTEEEWDQTIDINLKGSFLCAQAVARDMVKRNWGRIINISSVACGQVGIAYPNLAHYVASKGGMAGLTEALALELSPMGINVNSIGPGVIGTEMAKPLEEAGAVDALLESRVPKGRVGTPEDIGHLAVFLASEESDYITGAMIFIDGGWLTT